MKDYKRADECMLELWKHLGKSLVRVLYCTALYISCLPERIWNDIIADKLEVEEENRFQNLKRDGRIS